MTGPASVGIERGTGAPSRSTGTQGAVGAVLLVLALGLALRLIIAQMVPGSGFGVDLSAFRFWMEDLARNGPGGFYERDFFHDYTPGYLYVLWLVGSLGNLFQWDTWPAAAPSLGFLKELDLKAPAILADLAVGWLVWSMVRELGGRDRLALDRRVRRGDEPGDVVRQRPLGPGGLVRRRLPAARTARAVARPSRASRDLHGHRRPDQAAARASSSRSWPSSRSVGRCGHRTTRRARSPRRRRCRRTAACWLATGRGSATPAGRSAS